MQRLMATGGLEIFATDDPEITSHPANCLMAELAKYYIRTATSV